MKKKLIVILQIGLVSISLAAITLAQKAPVKTLVIKPKPIIFAVVYNGSTIEPIAYVDNGKLVNAPDAGSDEGSVLSAFRITYYKPKASYRLIFGGRDAGTVTVKPENEPIECGPNMSGVVLSSSKAKLRGSIMALATDAPAAKPASGVRRVPTAAERSEIEKLVRAEFAKHKIDSKPLKSQNLTAVDVDSDGKAEFVGSYWVAPSPKTRALLFFIAGKQSNGKYGLGFSELQNVEEENVMSGDISTIDSGVYHELLLDVFDYDSDGVAEIFTTEAGFEGAGFNAYRREGNKWVKSFEGSNYHCGY